MKSNLFWEDRDLTTIRWHSYQNTHKEKNDQSNNVKTEVASDVAVKYSSPWPGKMFKKPIPAKQKQEQPLEKKITQVQFSTQRSKATS